jgi:hypothetical protein
LAGGFIVLIVKHVGREYGAYTEAQAPFFGKLHGRAQQAEIGLRGELAGEAVLHGVI